MILIKRVSNFKKWLRMNLKYERTLLQKIKIKYDTGSKEYKVKEEQINDLKIQL